MDFTSRQASSEGLEIGNIGRINKLSICMVFLENTTPCDPPFPYQRNSLIGNTAEANTYVGSASD